MRQDKKIIIGKKGSMIKDIGTLARKDIVNLLGNKVYLELFVKVVPNWRDNKMMLRSLGYDPKNT
jgi:GTP-binding protein Era